MQIFSAVCTDEKSREHIVLALVCLALADTCTFLLHTFPELAWNNGLMCILEDDPVLTVVFKALFVLV